MPFFFLPVLLTAGLVPFLFLSAIKSTENLGLDSKDAILHSFRVVYNFVDALFLTLVLDFDKTLLSIFITLFS